MAQVCACFNSGCFDVTLLLIPTGVCDEEILQVDAGLLFDDVTSVALQEAADANLQVESGELSHVSEAIEENHIKGKEIRPRD